VTYSPDGRWFATVDAKTRLVWIWDAHTNKRLLELGTHSNGAIWSVQFSPDGRLLSVASEGDGLMPPESPSGRLNREPPMTIGSGSRQSLCDRFRASSGVSVSRPIPGRSLL